MALSQRQIRSRNASVLFRSLLFGATWLVAIVFANTAARAQDVKDAPGGPEPTAAQRRLVRQLGDPSFFAREQATEELARHGLTARAALTEALTDPDLEIRWRAGRLLKRVREQAFEARLTAFIEDVDGNGQHGLPAWEKYRELVGDSRDAREMFAAMTRCEAALLAAYDAQSPDLPKLFTARVAWLNSQADNGNVALRVLSQASVATVLMIGGDKKSEDHAQSVSRVYALLSKTEVMQSIGTLSQPTVLQNLLEQWVTQAGSTNSYYGTAITLKYNLKELGLRQAKQVLQSGTTSASSLRDAAIAVGRFGGKEHAELLTPLLENKTVCNQWTNRSIKKEGTIDTQVRDVALVVSLRLSGKDPSQYGFKLLQENPETLYHIYTCGFITNEEREAAHAKWAAKQ